MNENQIQPIEKITASIVSFAQNEVDSIIASIRASALSIAADPSTKKGRDELKSTAYKVAQSKSHLVKLANASIEEARATVNTVTSIRTSMEKQLDALRDEVKRPAIEWEQREEARIESITDRIKQIDDLANGTESLSSNEIKERVEIASNLFEGFDFQEQSNNGSSTHEYVIETLSNAIHAAIKREADAAELERLRALEAARIAAETAAREAEEARLVAERKAQRQAEAERVRKQQEDLRIKQAEEAAIIRERQRIEAEHQEALAREQERIHAERRKREAEELAEAKRKADSAHRAKIRTEVEDALRKHVRMSPSDATLSVEMIERGMIPHITITF